MRLRDGIGLRALLATAAAVLLLGLTVAITGGVSLRVGDTLLRSHSVVPSSVIVALLLALAATAGRDALASALSWWWHAVERHAARGAIVVALGDDDPRIQLGHVRRRRIGLGPVTSIRRSSSRAVRCMTSSRSQPTRRGRGHRARSSRLGTRVYPGASGAFVPICPAGYPVLLAAARTVGGRSAMFWITPLMAALVVWLAFVLARRIGGPSAGLLASILTAASPPFVFQSMQVMNDVTVTAAWCVALVAAGRAGGTPLSRSIVSGLLAGAALTVRPNLLPLAAVVALWIPMSMAPFRVRTAVVALATFAIALVPGVLFVLAVQNAMYGSPFRSGYGELSDLFSAANIRPNLARYPRWLVELHTPLILTALVSPLVAPNALARRYCLWLLLFAGTVFACYLPYLVFDAWWYLRFVLPAIPPLLALTAFVIARIVQRAPLPARAIAFLVTATALAVLCFQIARRHDAFSSRDFEWRFRAAGEYIAAQLPANSAFVTSHQTGSIRFYSGRSTVGWRDIDPGRLDDALEFLRRHGRKPYLLFEAWEEPAFQIEIPERPTRRAGVASDDRDQPGSAHLRSR